MIIRKITDRCALVVAFCINIATVHITLSELLDLDPHESLTYGITTEADIATGAVKYTIPIPAPIGRAGLQPNIALSYNSYLKNGWIGMGWDLEMGAIQRSTRKGLL